MNQNYNYNVSIYGYKIYYKGKLIEVNEKGTEEKKKYSDELIKHYKMLAENRIMELKSEN